MEEKKQELLDFVEMVASYYSSSGRASQPKFSNQLDFINTLSVTLSTKKVYVNIEEIETYLSCVDFSLLGTGDIVIYKNDHNILVGMVLGVAERQIMFYYDDCAQLELLTKNNLLEIPYSQGYGIR